MRSFIKILLALLVLVAPLSAQEVNPATPNTPGFTINSFDTQYIYYNDNAGNLKRTAVTPIQMLGTPTGSCVGTVTAVNTLNNFFYYCLSGSWQLISGGDGGGGSPAGATNCVQTNGGNSIFGCGGASDNGTVFAITENISASGSATISGATTIGGLTTINAAELLNGNFSGKGPNPSIDITRYGGYQGATTPPTITCNTTSGLNTISCSGGASDFIVGHGVAIPAVGATPTTLTPGAPVVISTLVLSGNQATFTLSSDTTFTNTSTVIVASATDGTLNGSYTSVSTTDYNHFTASFTHANCNPCTIGGSATVVANTVAVVSPEDQTGGTTTWNYKVAARDFHGGLSAASAAMTTTVGFATLGVQSYTLTNGGCSWANGVETFTTTAAHNIPNTADHEINIVRGSTGNNLIEGARLSMSAPSATTFTVDMQSLSAAAGTCASGGTVQVVAKNLVQWIPQPGNSTGYAVWRSQGAGSYSLVALTGGQDSAFEDWGLGAPTLGPPDAAYIPATPPASPINGILATTITNISGTTVTLATTAGASVTSATVLHDNVPNVMLACNTTSTGGEELLFPGFSVMVINSPLLSYTCPGTQKQFTFKAQMQINEPIIAKGLDRFAGDPQGSFGSIFDFQTAPTTAISCNSFPCFLLTPFPALAAGVSFANLNINVFRSYQNGVLVDQDSTGNNVTTTSFSNTAIRGGDGTIPLRHGGGFGFYMNFGEVGAGISGWGKPPSWLDTINRGLGQNAQQLISILYVNNVTTGHVVFESGGIQVSAGPGHQSWTEMLSESDYYPTFRFHVPSPSLGVIGTTFTNVSYADTLGGFATPVFEFGDSLVNGFVYNGFYSLTCGNGFQPLFAGSVSSNSQAVDLFNPGCPFVGLSKYSSHGNGSMAAVNTSIQASGTGQVSYGMSMMTAPVASLTAGGSLPAAQYCYRLVPYDVNSNLGPPSLVSNCVTTNGSQQVALTWTPVAGQVGANLCRSNLPTNGFGCAGAGGGIFMPGSSFTDNSPGFDFNNSFPLTTTTPGGASTVGANGLTSSMLRIVGGGFADTITGMFSTPESQVLPDVSGTIAVLTGAFTVSDCLQVAGSGITLSIVDSGAGCGGGGGGGATFKANGTNLTSQAVINFQNSSAFDGITVSASNPSAGNVVFSLSGSATNAFLANSSITVNTTAPLTGGGAVSLGSSITVTCATCNTATINSGTANHLAEYTGATTISSDGALDDGATAANTLTYGGSGGIVTPQLTTNSGGGGAITVAEGSTPAGVAASDILFGNLSSHRLGMINNAGSTLVVAANPMTAAGSLTYGASSVSGVAVETALAAGTSVQVLHSGTTPSWGPVVLTTDVSGLVPIANGGTNAATAAAALINLFPAPTRAGDIAYWNGSAFVLLAGNNSGTQCYQENASGVPTFGSCGGGGGALSAITAAVGSNTLANGNNPQVWNWAQTTASQSAFTFGETTAASGSGDIELNIKTLNTSTAIPWQVTAQGTTVGWNISTAGLLEPLSTGALATGGTAHGFTLSEGASTALASLVCATNTVPLGAGSSADPTCGAVPNAALANASVTFNTVAVALGASGTITLDLIGNPAASKTFTFPASGVLSLVGTAAGSSGGAGTNAGTFLNVGAVTGGATTGSATTAGNGSAIALATGDGGSGSGGTNANGGNAGSFSFTVGTGGAKSGSGAAGNTGVINFLQDVTTAVANSPLINITGEYQNAGTPTFATDTWSVQDVIAAGTNGASTLTWTHSGTAGTATFSLPNPSTATTQSQLDGSTKVATTSYVDTAVSNAVAGVNPAQAVLVATVGSNLTGTYAQVGGGVGDTFTITATGVFTLDGVTLSTIGQRVLFKDQSTASQNGVYTVTVPGSVGVSPVFTRALDYDTVSDVNNSGIVPVQSGTVNTDTSWLLTSQVTSIGSSGSSLTYTQFSLAPSNIVTAASNFTSGNLVQAAGNNKTTSDSGVATANVVTAASNAGAAKQVWTAGGANKTAVAIDFPQAVYAPAADCVNAVAGSGWSTGATPAALCRAGTNNKDALLSPWGASDVGYFKIHLPNDWDSTASLDISIDLTSTDATNGHTIIMQAATVCAKGDGSTTDDVAFNSAQAFGTITLNGNANRTWNATLTGLTKTGCIAGSTLWVKISRTTDTATNVGVYGATVDVARLITVQAN